jgi:hypothetical protein
MGDLRQRLKAAVDATQVPAGLQMRVQSRLATRLKPKTPRVLFFAVPAVVACALLVTVYFKGYLPVSFGQQASYIASVSADLPDVIKVGLGDHIHCAVFRKYPKTPLADQLGVQYSALLPVVQSHIPPGYSLKLAHQCHYLGRKFIHVVAGDGQHLASLVITAKGENDGLPPAEASAARFRISAFESGSYLVYFISDMPAARNAELLAAMATQVKAVLKATES